MVKTIDRGYSRTSPPEQSDPQIIAAALRRLAICSGDLFASELADSDIEWP